MFEGRHMDYQSSKVGTSITDLRRSTHRSSVFEGQHIHLRRSTHRSSKVDTSISEGRHIVTSIFEGRYTIFESRHIDHRKSTHRSSKIERGNITPTFRRRILFTIALLSPWSRRSYTRSYVYTCIFKYIIFIIFNIRKSATATHA